MHFTNLPIGISVVMSKGIGPSAFKIDIPTIAKMVKKTNLQNSFLMIEEPAPQTISIEVVL